MEPNARLEQPAARHVLATFVHIDRILDNALRHAGIAAPKAFSGEYDDFTADEVFLLSETVEEIRTALVRLLGALELEPDSPSVPARWAVQTDWHFAETALAELARGGLRAWGARESPQQRRLADEAERLRGRLANARVLLSAGHPGARATPESLAPGPALAPLRPLFASRALAPLHGALRAAADQLREPDLVIGVFGRVSAGKSSLVNALLDEAVLPAGAIPTTRRIVRVRHGPPALHLRARDGAPLGVKPWEERNEWLGGNAETIYQCELRHPAAPPGTAWLDTPGLGATHPALGAAAARAVGGSDMVILCLGAGALPGLDERALLARAGAQAIPVHLVVTQSDRLRDEELRALMEWLGTNFSDTAQSIVAAATTGGPGLGRLHAVLAPALYSPGSTASHARRARLENLFAAARSLVAVPNRGNAELAAIVGAAESALDGIVADAPRRGEEGPREPAPGS